MSIMGGYQRQPIDIDSSEASDTATEPLMETVDDEAVPMDGANGTIMQHFDFRMQSTQSPCRCHGQF